MVKRPQRVGGKHRHHKRQIKWNHLHQNDDVVGPTNNNSGGCFPIVVVLRVILVVIGCLVLVSQIETWKDLIKPLSSIIQSGGTTKKNITATTTTTITKSGGGGGGGLSAALLGEEHNNSTTLSQDDPTSKEGEEVRSIVHYIAMSKQQNHDKEQILELLRDHAAFTHLDQDQYEALPTWQQIVNLYGTKARLVGASMEQCKAFQSKNSKKKYLAVAGMFNSGTNLLAQALLQNCIIDPPGTAVPTTTMPTNPGPSMTGILWQVGYGKHSPPHNTTFRRQAYKHFDYNNVLPVVVIRDPLWWMISLCSDIYTTHWPKLFGPNDPNYHCPSLWPTDVEMMEFPKRNFGPIVVGQNDATFSRDNNGPLDLPVGNVDQGINPYLRGQPTQNSTASDIPNHHYFPIHVVYKNYKRHYYSKLHLWNQWYQEYYHLHDDDNNSPEHRIMLRMEDLLFHTQEVVEQVCTCAGGHLVRANHTNNTNATTTTTTSKVQIPTNSAKYDHESQSRRNGYLESIIKTGNAIQRSQSFTQMDLQYIQYHIDKELMQQFQYNTVQPESESE